MDPDATLPPPDHSLGDQPTIGYEGGDPPRVPPTATGLADDGDAPDVPGYEVRKELGRGGMGVVYLARQVSLNRSVALKLLPTGKQLGSLVRQRFQAEAESAARISHPGVVGVYEIGEHAGRPYFALEYCPGGSLAAKLAGTPLSPRQAAEVVERVARAVQAAHDAGVIHRDLKPDNVLFAADRSPKVADFGLAKPVQTDSHLTSDGAILGTPSYMAPEQARGDSKLVGPPADIYALGAVLYECLTGRPPFRAATLLETLSQVMTADPVPPRKLVPGLPKDLETVCLKCLEKDAARRYPSAAAVADDLRSWLDGRLIVARPVSLPERVWKTLRRRPEIGVIAGVVCAAVGTVVGVLASSNASLSRERNAAVAAQRQAEESRQQADAQKRKADDTLAAAVDAIESMVGQAGGESWLFLPQMQEERRRLLGDAVVFYERLAARDGDDPVVMKGSAKAHLQAGQGWLGLGESEKAKAACREAARLADALAAAAPDDPDRANAAADAHSYLGHVWAVGGDYPAALREYQAALDLAGRAVAARPGAAEFKLTLVSAHGNLAQYFGFSDPAAGFRHALDGERLAGELTVVAGAPYPHRLAHVQALVLVGNGHLLANRLADAGAKYAAAQAAFDALGPPPGAAMTTDPRMKPPGRKDRLPAPLRGSRPSSGVTEGLFRTSATISIQRGVVRFRTARGPADLQASLKLMQDGLNVLDLLLRAMPKSFPYRVLKHQTLAALVEVHARLRDGPAGDKALADLEAVAADILADNPSSAFVIAAGAGQRSNRLVRRVQAGDTAAFAADAAGLLAAIDALDRTKPNLEAVWYAVRYNVACGHAQMTTHTAGRERERHASAAAGLLAELAAADAFRVPSRAKLLADDADLDPLRDRDDFQALAARVLEFPDR